MQDIATCQCSFVVKKLQLCYIGSLLHYVCEIWTNKQMDETETGNNGDVVLEKGKIYLGQPEKKKNEEVLREVTEQQKSWLKSKWKDKRQSLCMLHKESREPDNHGKLKEKKERERDAKRKISEWPDPVA